MIDAEHMLGSNRQHAHNTHGLILGTEPVKALKLAAQLFRI
jgi:hypothetical protein